MSKKTSENVSVSGLQVEATPERMIPKMATRITVGKTNSNIYVVSFLSALADEQPLLIERVAIDDHLLTEFLQLLQQAKEATNE
jgi:hypothetical protein